MACATRSLERSSRSPPEKVRVVTGDVGGGFGTKTFMYREYPLAAEAARRLRRPVKWVADRADHFTADAHGRDNISIGERCPRRRRPLPRDALRHPRQSRRVSLPVRPVYSLSRRHDDDRRLPHAGRSMCACAESTPIPFRSTPIAAPVDPRPPICSNAWSTGRPGRPASSADAIRRRNFIRADEMPYSTPICERTYDTGDFAAHMTEATEAGRLGRFSGPTRCFAEGGQAARHRACDLHRVHRLGRGRGCRRSA